MSRKPKRTERLSARMLRQPGQAAIHLDNVRGENLRRPDPALDEGSRYKAWAVCGFLLLAVGLAFGQTVCHEFINLDDGRVCLEEPPPDPRV